MAHVEFDIHFVCGGFDTILGLIANITFRFIQPVNHNPKDNSYKYQPLLPEEVSTFKALRIMYFSFKNYL